jgi:hypothetical protein
MTRYALFAIIVLLPRLAAAQSVTCGGKIINEGVTKAQVAASCGPPTLVGDRSSVHDPAIGAVAPPSSDDGEIEVWTYDFGRTKLMQRIWFLDGRVKLVESLGYGH